MTEQNPDQGQMDPKWLADPAVTTQPAVTDPAPAPASTPVDAPAPAAPVPAPVDQPAPTSAPADTTLADTTPAKAAPAVGDLCTFSTEDEAGFVSLTTCLVFEVFTEPDENGDEVPLARVGVLPDERIVRADRLEHRS